MPLEPDTRFVYGANCAWFGPIQSVGKRDGLPCCPGCGGMLFECDSAEVWWNEVRRQDLESPGFLALMQWLDIEFREGRHFATYSAAASAYMRETGKATVVEVRA